MERAHFASSPGAEVLTKDSTLSRLRARLTTAARPAAARLARAVASYHVFRTLRISASERLRAAPPDLRTGDVTVAEELYAGLFNFNGKSVGPGASSPFSARAPAVEWRRALCGFSWLRHLRAAHASWARERAQALVAEFLKTEPTRDDPAREPAVVARRMLSLLAHSQMLAEQAPREFHDAFMASLARDAQILARAAVGGHVEGLDRLLCALGLMEFCICAELGADTRVEATALFLDELARQVLPDGGHADRNPHTILDLLLDLLPLRALYAARGVNPPPALLAAIERMNLFLRAMRHGDGALALFNGMSVTAPGELATVFMHEAHVVPGLLKESGYLRLAAGEGIVIIDGGLPPPREFSQHAHAGALSFEFSLDRERVVVNSGAAGALNAAGREAARASGAHSTLMIGGESSALFTPLSSRRGGGLISSGPRVVAARRRSVRCGEFALLAHDGYVRRFDLIHRRRLGLAADGATLYGQDVLLASKPSARHKTTPELALRFILHPAVEAEVAETGEEILLLLPSGRALVFEIAGVRPMLEDAFFYASPEGRRRTKQIVIRAPAVAGARLRWSFRVRPEPEEVGPEDA